MLRLLVELHIAHEVHTGAWCLQCQVGVHALPVLMEEIIGDAGLLVEEDEGTEVGLLV